jgi:hypothetical protein
MIIQRRTVCLSSIALALAAAVAVQPARAAETSPAAALATADLATPSYYRQGIVWEVVVEHWEGGTKKSFQQLRLRTKGESTLAEFVAPPILKGRKLLMKDRAMWFLKPGLSKPVPISPRQRLLGSAAYGDLASINYVQSYAIVASREESLGSDDCYVFDLVAKKREEVYPKLRYWVSKRRKLGIMTEYYTESGTLLKSAEFEFDNKLTVADGARQFLSRMVIHDPNSRQSVSVLRFGRVELQPMSDATFDLNLLTQ